MICCLFAHSSYLRARSKAEIGHEFLKVLDDNTAVVIKRLLEGSFESLEICRQIFVVFLSLLFNELVEALF